MKRIALLLAATVLASPAIAADVIYAEPAAPVAMMDPVVSWTGLYLGVQGGGAFNPSEPDRQNISANFGNNTIIPGLAVGGTPGTINRAFGNSFDSSFDSSFIGGAHVGYDYQMGSFVVGALLDINAVDLTASQSSFSNTPAFYTVERSIDYLATARLRAGYLVTPRALAYATGGLAYAEIDNGFSTDSPAVSAANPAFAFEDEDDFGYSVGGGMEVLVMDNLSFGAEYLYTNLGSGNSGVLLAGGPFDGLATAGTATVPGRGTTFTSTGDFDFHTITAKLSYRFN